MKKLFLVRHGQYDNGRGHDPELSSVGRQEVKISAGRIDKILNGEPASIWSSTAARATMTANVLSANLNIDTLDIDYFKELWADNHPDHKYQPVWLMEQLRAFEGDNLIIVTHMEYVDYIPWLWSQKGGNFNSTYADVVYIEEDEIPRLLSYK